MHVMGPSGPADQRVNPAHHCKCGHIVSTAVAPCEYGIGISSQDVRVLPRERQREGSGH